jgi:cell division initiation protein
LGRSLPAEVGLPWPTGRAPEERRLRLTPLDIQKHRFARRWRGLDPAEVEAFLQFIGEDYEALLRDRDALAERIRGLEARVAELTGNEKALQETLVMAQTLSDDLKKTAMKESEVLVSEAEVKAEKILDASHRRAARLAEDIREMKLLRARLGTALRQTIETHLAMLETLTADASSDEAEDGKVAYLARARVAPQQG